MLVALGDVAAELATSRQVDELLTDVAATVASPRTVNKHRRLVCAIFSHGCQEPTVGLAISPAFDRPAARPVELQDLHVM